MAIEVGKTYTIIGSANGPKGPSVGRKCITLFPYTDRPPHSLWGQIWRVKAVDGKEFISEHGGVGMEVDVAEDWLQEYKEPPKSQDTVQEKDLVISGNE